MVPSRKESADRNRKVFRYNVSVLGVKVLERIGEDVVVVKEIEPLWLHAWISCFEFRVGKRNRFTEVIVAQ